MLRNLLMYCPWSGGSIARIRRWSTSPSFATAARDQRSLNAFRATAFYCRCALAASLVFFSSSRLFFVSSASFFFNSFAYFATSFNCDFSSIAQM